jgi:hypothetical protein
MDDIDALPILKIIMDNWIVSNQEQLDKLCTDLLVNYSNNKTNN